MRFSASASYLFLLLGLSALSCASNVEKKGNVCTVKANGHQKDDVPNLLTAFKECGNGGTIIFPEDQSYWIAQRLNPVLNNVAIEWRGKWTFSDDLSYWRNHSYPVAFQNHAAGFVITGHNITINGYGTGGIDGNGNVWYTAEAGTTQPGRPMPFVFWNVSNVEVESFYVKDPPLWSLNIMNGTNMRFNDITCNATAVDAPYGSNWVQNTDGFDTMDATNIQLTNFVYQGGDDCIAIKPRSYNIDIQNVTCRGGNGIAIGSLGQYLEDSSVGNIKVDKVKIIRYNEDMHNSAYIKTWVGALVPQDSYESDYLPRGGGWGSVKNIIFSNFDVQGANAGPAISESSGDNGSYAGTSKMLISNIAFVNFTGWIDTSKSTTSSVSCSTVYPCYNIEFDNVVLYPQNSTTAGTGSCSYTADGGVHGLSGC
ncbi:putative extracellular exo-polygalacturonase [Aspergillus saccharolyticus JOP 1030-1]|uniref:galacturonan 1,4-alpha-galacturonidase n=1 Tax=Aspergillus saccharolyticus JOP 1030-1 TaxID=1450539 RepID=A0A318Z2E4_9EURO|nr:putative galacturan 1,4-alpha-galacturonidase C [Aspergillus saccharolyticus JOP 1030-1]PYH41481.1 putative galacturan 1,4-alpha-galacturonidase C [Aspergillus saccharolyticus JOP 1030-1]